MLSVSRCWGTLPEERRLRFPCDDLILNTDAALYRGVTINASPELVFRWLCQMRVAPYSYDLIDNGGRQSPQKLIPGLEQLEVGQDVMTIFSLVSFKRNEHLTIRLKPNRKAPRIFGDIAVSYLVAPIDAERCRLLVKLVVKHRRGATGALLRRFLPWGDLIMMRRQLLNFKTLAEGSTDTHDYRS
ncbi:MAG: hypothetical protein ACREBG_26925 [Pyrinomonadaceae bacterium]